MKTKFRVYRALIEPIVLYGAESWTLTDKIKEKLDVFDRECIRTILGISWEDRINNEDLKEKSRQLSMSEKAASRIIRWAGHVFRMDNKRLARRVERWQPTGSRTRGQQRARWKDKAIGEARLRGAKGRNNEEIEKLPLDRVKLISFQKLNGTHR